jgi:hypothetical protein
MFVLMKRYNLGKWYLRQQNEEVGKINMWDLREHPDHVAIKAMHDSVHKKKHKIGSYGSRYNVPLRGLCPPL